MDDTVSKVFFEPQLGIAFCSCLEIHTLNGIFNDIG